MDSRVDLSDFVSGFLIEAEEHLHSSNRNLVAVSEALKQSRLEPRAIRDLFRSLHTIKGLAAMVGAEPIVDISHEMEGLLRNSDRSGGTITESAVDLLAQGIRAIEERVREVSKTGVKQITKAAPKLLEALALAQGIVIPARAVSEFEIIAPEGIAEKLTASDREQILQAAQSGSRSVLIEFEPSPEKAEAGINITSVRASLATLGTLIRVVPRSSTTSATGIAVGSSRVDLQACKLEYSIVSPK